ncbi:MAG: hypothetical protein ACYDCK_11155 [Thermoplasmatota archaeon]
MMRARDALARGLLALALAITYTPLLGVSPVFLRIKSQPLPPPLGDLRVVAIGVTLALAAGIPALLPRRAHLPPPGGASALIAFLGTFDASRIDWTNVVTGGEFARHTTPSIVLYVLGSLPFVVLGVYLVLTRRAELARELAARGALVSDVARAETYAVRACFSAFAIAFALQGLIALALFAVPPWLLAVRLSPPASLAAVAMAAILIGGVLTLRGDSLPRD